MPIRINKFRVNKTSNLISMRGNFGEILLTRELVMVNGIDVLGDADRTDRDVTVLDLNKYIKLTIMPKINGYRLKFQSTNGCAVNINSRNTDELFGFLRSSSHILQRKDDDIAFDTISHMVIS